MSTNQPQATLLLSEFGFQLLHETPKAILWGCPHGQLWEPKSRPFQTSGLQDALVDKIERVTEVAVVQQSECGQRVRVEFFAKPVLERDERDPTQFILGAAKCKTAWLPAAAVREQAGQSVCSPRWLKSALAELGRYAQSKARRRGPQPYEWLPVTTSKAFDRQAFIEWFEKQKSGREQKRWEKEKSEREQKRERERERWAKLAAGAGKELQS